MSLRISLFQIAALLSAAAACGGKTTEQNSQFSNPDEPTSGDLPVGCGGCGCGSPSTTTGQASAEQACKIADPTSNYEACVAFCGSLPGNTPNASYFCSVSLDVKSDGGDAGCVAPDSGVVVTCGYPCLGRRTEGIAAPSEDGGDLGTVFANRAYLEAVSVHAFARLERELAFHHAPPVLRREARRARRDEIRHTAMTLRLARRFGGRTSLPEAPEAVSPRTLFEIARENAVEGCVRETYGAVIGLLEARESSDRDVRRASRQIADDECRHAELAMSIARWIEPLLTADERAAVRNAMAASIAALHTQGDARIVALLSSHVWAA